jgi:ferredoxin, 2Fe-2S
MPKITIQPLGVTIEAERGQTIMDAARAAGYYWPTSCDGRGECTTCAGAIEKGAQNLSPMGRYENLNIVRQRGRMALKSTIRLCCQARVEGDVEVRKPGVKPW